MESAGLLGGVHVLRVNSLAQFIQKIVPVGLNIGNFAFRGVKTQFFDQFLLMRRERRSTLSHLGLVVGQRNFILESLIRLVQQLLWHGSQEWRLFFGGRTARAFVGRRKLQLLLSLLGNAELVEILLDNRIIQRGLTRTRPELHRLLSGWAEVVFRCPFLAGNQSTVILA